MSNILTTLDKDNMDRLNNVLQYMKIDQPIFKIDNFERYYALFSQIIKHKKDFKIKYLFAKNNPHIATNATGIYYKHDDEIPICLHSWYSRDTSKQNYDRIFKIYSYAKTLLDKEI